jgi:NAD(P)-dependent dehydrogenase (short-subunit alcohol dehydrogenase family)
MTRKTALVTGASEGLGRAIAVALGQDGFDVAVSELDPARLAATVAEIEKAGARAIPIALDLRDLASLERIVAQIGHIDVLVNNAGVTLRKAALEITPAAWNEVMAVNLTGTFFLSQQVGRQLVERKAQGSIVSIASTHGMVGFAERAAYGISKGAIVQMTRMLAIEWAPHGIRVNAVAPGTVETPSRAQFLADPQKRADMLDRIPLGRFGTPSDVASAVCYLAGERGGYITGQTLILDGGLTAY